MTSKTQWEGRWRWHPGRQAFQGPRGGTGMCLKDRRVLSDLCAATLELPGCCQRENRLLQVPSPVGVDGVEAPAWWVGPTPIRRLCSPSQALLQFPGSADLRLRERVQPAGARQRTEGGGEAVCFSSEHDPSECLKPFSLNILNPALKTVWEGKIGDPPIFSQCSSQLPIQFSSTCTTSVVTSLPSKAQFCNKIC